MSKNIESVNKIEVPRNFQKLFKILRVSSLYSKSLSLSNYILYKIIQDSLSLSIVLLTNLLHD